MFGRWRAWAGYAAAVVVAAVITVPNTFGGDIRYEIGAKAVSTHSAAGTFTHRPLAYRLLSSLITAPAEAWGDGVVRLELILRVECVLLSALAAGVLWLGLRRWAAGAAPPVAVSVFVGLVLVGPRATLEPDWLAVVLTVAGAGTALLFRRLTVGAVVGGVLLAAAAAVKIISVPVAVIGLIVILLFDRRRALWTMAAAGVVGVIYLVIMVVAAPHELRWLLDLGSVQDASKPLPVTLGYTAKFLGNVVVLWPVVALVPAALVGAPRRPVFAAAAAVVLAWIPAQVQAQYYPYHLSALPVVATVIVVLGLRSAPTALAVLAVAYTVWCTVVLTAPLPWRTDHAHLVFVVAGVVSLVALVLRVALWPADRRRPTAGTSPSERSVLPEPLRAPGRRTCGPVVASLTVTVAALAASTPFSYASVNLADTQGFSPVQQRAVTAATTRTADKIRAHIGSNSVVTYLTFGDFSFFLGNPTTCRYPSPVFLQRGMPEAGEPATHSWTEALQCITDTPGDWLIWDTNWFKLRRQPSIVREAIAGSFDCDQAFKAGTMRACPRRTTVR